MKTNSVKKSTTTEKKLTLADLNDRVEILIRTNTHLIEANARLEAAQHQIVLEVLDRLLSRMNSVQSERAEAGTLDYRELCRALLLSRDRCDAAISLAIRRYIDVLTDRRQLREEVRKDDMAGLMLYKMLQRYQVYHRQDLEALGVSVQEVVAGNAIDPAIHNVVATKPATRSGDVDTIADCITPLLTWADSKNTPQLRAAEVVAFVKVPDLIRAGGKRVGFDLEKNGAAKP